MVTAPRSAMELRDYLAVMRRRKWVIAFTAVVVITAALSFSLLQTPIYEAKARILIQPNSTVFGGSSGQPQSPVQAQTEIQVMESAPVQALVRQRLGTERPISAIQVGETNVVELRAESPRPADAAKIANAYAESYITYRRQQAIDGLLAAGEQIRQKIADLQTQIDEAAVRDSQRPPPQTGPSAESDALVNQQALFKQKLDQLQVDAALKDGGAQLVGPATVATDPIRPTTRRNVALAAIVGVIFGLAIAFFLDHLDDSIQSHEDFERLVTDVSILGSIPVVPGWKNRDEPRIVSLVDPSSPAAEAYRSLRTAVSFLSLDRSLKVLAVTSPSSAEGKTTTVANLAVAVARTGMSVLIIDCDLRRPRIHEFFGLANDIGFTSVLYGEVPLSDAVQEVPEVSLRVLAAGPRPPNPSELLSSNRAGAILAAAAAAADLVLIDAPPVLPVTDAAVLSTRVDALILVVNARSTSGKEAAHAVRSLRRVDASIAGIVLNGAALESSYGASYGYEYVPTGRRGGNGNGDGNGNAKKRRGATSAPRSPR